MKTKVCFVGWLVGLLVFWLIGSMFWMLSQWIATNCKYLLQIYFKFVFKFVSMFDGSKYEQKRLEKLIVDIKER